MRPIRTVASQCWLGFLVIILGTTAAVSQSTPTEQDQPQVIEQPATADNQNTAAQAQPQDQNQTPSPVPIDLYSEKGPVSLATGQSLSTTRSPLHWGKLSVLSFDLLQVYDSNFNFSATPATAQAGAVEGLIVYSIRSRRGNFDLQYRPQLWVASDVQQVDYASHALDFNTFHYLGPNWGFNISDQFQYSPERGRLDQVGFTSNYSTSTSQQNPFLDNGERLLSNSAAVSALHRLDARNRIEFLARYQYIHTSEPTQSSSPFSSAVEQQDFGGEVGWTHVWRRDNEFGAKYAYDREYFHGFDSTAELHSALFSFSRRLLPSVVLRLTGGPAVLFPATSTAVLSRNARPTYEASAALYKSFRHSGITLSYARTNNFSGQVSDDLNDRYEASYSQKLFHRLNVLVGGAYVHQEFSNAPAELGKAGWAQLNYRLSRAWSIYASYSYLTQQSGVTALIPRQLISSGIRWSWGSEREQPDQRY